MTVSGFVSGLLDPHGAGYALSRVANRAEATRVSEIGPAKKPGENIDQPVDQVELSPEALAAADQADKSSQESSATPPSSDSNATKNDQALSDEERKQVDELKQRDREVRQHEQAHLSAAGAFAQGGPTFDYQTGPDGKRYAVGGEVQIDTSPVEGDPEATIRKMQTVRSAALAPGEPSSQDRSVAAQASAQIQQARAEQTSGQPETAEDDAEDAPSRPAGNAKSPYDKQPAREPELVDLLV